MTPLPFSPFIDVSLVDLDNRFVLDEHRFLRDITVWSTRDDPPPIFITEPSSNFLAAIRRELAPFVEQAARG